MQTQSRLRDVAKLAGVSLGTASQALNQHESVLLETRERVLAAANTLGYRARSYERNSNGHVRSAPSRLSVIGLLTKHDQGMPVEVNPFFSHVQAGVESECRAHNLGLMYASIEVDQSNHPLAWPRMVSERRVDGLIFVGTSITKMIGDIKRKLDKPIVLVVSYAPDFPFDSVEVDNVGGAFQAVSHLIQHGHTHIGLIGSNPASPPDILERRAGYLKALAQHGIAHSYIEDVALYRTESYNATQRLLRLAPHITAIFACNDDCAFGVMNAARDMGLNVPRDLSVVGFDDVDLAREVRPALTTVQVHKTWLGKLGVQQLVERVQQPGRPRLVVTVSTQLVERGSVRPPRVKGKRR
ncbi:MAG: LacI family transcriptional regulator [Anaerolineae bacterium]|nr:LacI family transcriptional regulator [Anaerolineae bacterium]